MPERTLLETVPCAIRREVSAGAKKHPEFWDVISFYSHSAEDEQCPTGHVPHIDLHEGNVERGSCWSELTVSNPCIINVMRTAVI